MKIMIEDNNKNLEDTTDVLLLKKHLPNLLHIEQNSLLRIGKESNNKIIVRIYY